MYTAEFYHEMSQTSEASVDVILNVLARTIPTTSSVIDVGAGVGSWIKGCLDRGCSNVLAVEGRWALDAKGQIPKELYFTHNLEEPLRIDKKFDLAICLEVAEHLSEKRAYSFIEDLTNLSDIILFSAAIPGQGGTQHKNERWQQYWADLFKANSYTCFDLIRPAIWDNELVRVEYRQNILLYVRDDRARRLDIKQNGPLMLNLVHPAISRNWGPGIKYSLKFLGKALHHRIFGDC
jgi:hypothetical protein